jgi:hypothetical protein
MLLKKKLKIISMKKFFVNIKSIADIIQSVFVGRSGTISFGPSSDEATYVVKIVVDPPMPNIYLLKIIIKNVIKK